MAAAIVSTKQLATTSDPSQAAPKQLLSSNFAQIVAQTGQRASNTKLTVDHHHIRTYNSSNGSNSEAVAHRYKIGELVWAKVNNNPWWPCRVSKNLNESYFRYEGNKLFFF